ncbi:50S ribosomal protein L17 [Candidatus Saccharibacteria bacterium]|nr:50S ribosomal protein L17 [Candidatus Saccharibacteria bacterium]MBR0372619.1 50S ribosomal protein L17 [Candidatus Saccharibacteria bacterium]
MHRHSYKGRKFGRETDQRLALKRGLMCSLVKYQSITTTLARAKEIRRDLEKLVTKARKGGLHNRRIIIARLNDLESANLLFDVIAPQIKRDSGYLRIERAGFRKGDNAEMGTISFVDEIDLEVKPEEKPKKETKVAKAKKSEPKKEDK